MSDQPLIIRDDQRMTVAWTEAAKTLRDDALARAGMVGRVSNAEENATAVAAQAEIAQVLKLCETTRKACKEPVLDFGRRIDDAAKSFSDELKQEQLRLARLIGDFQATEEAKRKAAEAANVEALTEIERRREEALANANSHEEREAIIERTNQEAAALPTVEPIRAEGQSVVEEWVIDSISEFQLMKARPDLVRKVEFDMVSIKSELKRGLTLPGVKAHKEIKSRVRAARPTPAIDIG